MNEVKESNIAIAKDVLDGYTETTSGAWIILYKGKQIKLPSGKSVWKKKNHASSALTNSFYYLFKKYREGNTPGEVTKELIKRDIVEIKQV